MAARQHIEAHGLLEPGAADHAVAAPVLAGAAAASGRRSEVPVVRYR